MMTTLMNRHHSRRQERLLYAIHRDVAFVFLGVFAYFIVAFVETRADDIEIRKLGPLVRFFRGYTDEHAAAVCDDHHHAGDNCNFHQVVVVGEDCHSSYSSFNQHQNNEHEHYTAPTGIIDAGFILTSPIHQYLAKNRRTNDALAIINSAFLVLPLSYVAYTTLWKGDFRLSFRLIATHLFRSLCGWFTWVPYNSMPLVHAFCSLIPADYATKPHHSLSLWYM